MATTKILPESALSIIKRSRPIYQIARKARFGMGSLMGARTVPGIPGRIHYNDFMLASTSEESILRYHGGAIEFVGLLGNALARCSRRWSDVESCLEIGCGYGRIVRALKQKIDPAKIRVCDVIPEGARFTANEFGAVYLDVPGEGGFDPSHRFDLVYLLSVYSHMPPDGITRNLETIEKSLAPGGVLVFTTHGPVSASDVARYRQYWLDQRQVSAALADEGFFFERYPHYREEYGLSWFTEPRMRALVADACPKLEFVSYQPAGLEKTQDVYVYRSR